MLILEKVCAILLLASIPIWKQVLFKVCHKKSGNQLIVEVIDCSIAFALHCCVLCMGCFFSKVSAMGRTAGKKHKNIGRLSTCVCTKADLEAHRAQRGGGATIF